VNCSLTWGQWLVVQRNHCPPSALAKKAGGTNARALIVKCPFAIRFFLSEEPRYILLTVNIHFLSSWCSTIEIFSLEDDRLSSGNYRSSMVFHLATVTSSRATLPKIFLYLLRHSLEWVFDVVLIDLLHQVEVIVRFSNYSLHVPPLTKRSELLAHTSTKSDIWGDFRLDRANIRHPMTVAGLILVGPSSGLLGVQSEWQFDI